MRLTPLFTAVIILSLSSIIWGQSESRLRYSISAPVAGFAAESGRPTIEAVERQAFDLQNRERRAKGLGALVWSDEIAAVARMHSENMAREKFFSHQGSDGSMVDERAERVGLVNWSAIGENIAFLRGFRDPAALAVEKWMESPGHRKNLLGPNWKESAIGAAVTADGTYYLTQVFILRK